MSDVNQHVVKNRDGSISVGSTQDVSDILRQNKYEADNNLNRKSGDHFGRKVASIPLNIINMWCKEWGVSLQELYNSPDMKAKMFARLRDPQWAGLRTDTGRI